MRRSLWIVFGDAAEDIASGTWLQAVRDLPSFRGHAAAFGYRCSGSPVTAGWTTAAA